MKTLNEILVEYFGSGFPLSESPTCGSYEKLIGLLYDVGNLTETDMEDLVETLDNISNENALRDSDGELIYAEEQIKEELICRGHRRFAKSNLREYNGIILGGDKEE